MVTPAFIAPLTVPVQPSDAPRDVDPFEVETQYSLEDRMIGLMTGPYYGRRTRPLEEMRSIDDLLEAYRQQVRFLLRDYRTAIERDIALERRVNELINGRRGITPDTAVRLAVFFGNDAAFWMHLQVAWDMRNAVRAARAQLRKDVAKGKTLYSFQATDAELKTALANKLAETPKPEEPKSL